MSAHWAESYIGKPWVSAAAGPAAFDCYGLVRWLYQQRLGVCLPVVDVSAGRPLSVTRAMRHYDYGAWRDVVEPAELDVVQMSHGRHPSHVGVWIDIDGGKVLHCVQGAGVAAQSVASLKANGWRVLNIYRREAHA